MPGSPPLWFSDMPYGTDAASLSDVLNVIAQDLPKHGFTDIQKSNFAVGCRTKNSHNVIAFVGSWPKSTHALVMSGGDDAKTSRDALVARLKSYKFL
jgi:hypothetical protein